MRLKFTENHYTWINENFYKFSTTKELAEAFNCYFHENTSRQLIGKKAKEIGLARENCLPYTSEQDRWLKENANTVPYSELAVMFAKQFGKKTTKGALQQHCNKIKIFAEDANKFNNNIAWNKQPLFSETVGSRGEVLIKTEKGWINKARYIYEQAFGEVPKTHQVIMLDNNKFNFELNNLYCIPKKYMVMMNRNHWCTGDREITLAAIMLCELLYKLKSD